MGQNGRFLANHISETRLRLVSNDFMHRSLDGLIVRKIIYQIACQNKHIWFADGEIACQSCHIW